MKAVFNVTIIHDRGTVALSNGREIGWFMKHKKSVPLKSVEHTGVHWH